MPFTFVEIEERRTRNLVVLFVVLVVLYIVSFSPVIWGLELIQRGDAQWTWRHTTALAILALGLAVLHWVTALPRLVDRVLLSLGARPLDPQDRYHQQLQNIVEESRVATGGKYQITPYVIPTVAVNACAVADLDGHAAIVATEGLLARLSRPQLEAVVGHEAGHIARGDSVTMTLFCGLFSLHEEALKQYGGSWEDDAADVRDATAHPYVLIVMFLIWVVATGKRICQMAISRQQEYRADAVAVRLMRNPLALAEALRIISRHWRGVGAPGESLSTIFIVDDGIESLAEQEGLAADLFATHPPVASRIRELLGMVRVSPADFEREMAERMSRPRPRRAVASIPLTAEERGDGRRWHVWLEEGWQGPFGLPELEAIKQLTPDTWIRPEDGDGTLLASQDPAVLKLLQGRYGDARATETVSPWVCPNCRLSLSRVLYEGAPLDTCPACGGCYVGSDRMKRLLAREEYEFPESVRRLAKLLPSVGGGARIARGYNEPSRSRLKDRQCPSCGSAVLRKFYTVAYLVEVEQCWACGLTWLDRGELELIQCLYEEGVGE